MMDLDDLVPSSHPSSSSYFNHASSRNHEEDQDEIEESISPLNGGEENATRRSFLAAVARLGRPRQNRTSSSSQHSQQSLYSTQKESIDGGLGEIPSSAFRSILDPTPEELGYANPDNVVFVTEDEQTKEEQIIRSNAQAEAEAEVALEREEGILLDGTATQEGEGGGTEGGLEGAEGKSGQLEFHEDEDGLGQNGDWKPTNIGTEGPDLLTRLGRLRRRIVEGRQVGPKKCEPPPIGDNELGEYGLACSCDSEEEQEEEKKGGEEEEEEIERLRRRVKELERELALAKGETLQQDEDEDEDEEESSEEDESEDDESSEEDEESSEDEEEDEEEVAKEADLLGLEPTPPPQSLSSNAVEQPLITLDEQDQNEKKEEEGQHHVVSTTSKEEVEEGEAPLIALHDDDHDNDNANENQNQNENNKEGSALICLDDNYNDDTRLLHTEESNLISLEPETSPPPPLLLLPGTTTTELLSFDPVESNKRMEMVKEAPLIALPDDDENNFNSNNNNNNDHNSNSDSDSEDESLEDFVAAAPPKMPPPPPPPPPPTQNDSTPDSFDPLQPGNNNNTTTSEEEEEEEKKEGHHEEVEEEEEEALKQSSIMNMELVPFDSMACPPLDPIMVTPAVSGLIDGDSCGTTTISGSALVPYKMEFAGVMMGGSSRMPVVNKETTLGVDPLQPPTDAPPCLAPPPPPPCVPPPPVPAPTGPSTEDENEDASRCCSGDDDKDGQVVDEGSGDLEKQEQDISNEEEQQEEGEGKDEGDEESPVGNNEQAQDSTTTHNDQPKQSQSQPSQNHQQADLTNDQILRYSRHLLLNDGFGVAGQKALLSSSVLVIGAGGIGSTVLLYLAASGIGKIGVVDFDCVEVSNLHRQIIHGGSNDHGDGNVGVNKAVSAAQAMTRLNPSINVVTVTEPLTHHNALELVEQYDLVVDASDNPQTRYLINDACVLAKNKPPLVSGSAIGTQGQLSVYNYVKKGEEEQEERGACYRCLYPKVNAAEGCKSCSDNGVLGTVPGLIGILQATEVLKILTNMGTIMHDRLLMYDAKSCEFYNVKKPPKKKQCAVCSGRGDCSEEEEIARIETMEQSIRFEATKHARGPSSTTGNGGDGVGAISDGDDDLPSEMHVSCLEYAKIREEQPPFSPSNKLETNDNDQESDSNSTSNNEKSGHILLDVRVPKQYDICALPNALNIPLEELPQKLSMLEEMAAGKRPIYCICRRGIASLEATKLIREAMTSAENEGERGGEKGEERDGFCGVFNIKGGLNAWKEEVDEDFPSY